MANKKYEAAPMAPAAMSASEPTAMIEQAVHSAVESMAESAEEAVKAAEAAAPSAVGILNAGPAATAALTPPIVTAGVEQTGMKTTANMEKAMKTAEEMVTFGQGNLEAFVKASQIWVAGVQDLSKQVAATAQAQVEQTVATFKALAGVKSLKEAVDLQTSLARTSMEKAVAETGKLTDASLKLTEQALAPLTARVTLAVEKFSRTA